LSKEESSLLVKYLDKNGNGEIDENEFKEKINYDEY
jgi:Ca2+-binding EF-hand superfamily protein